MELDSRWFERYDRYVQQIYAELNIPLPERFGFEKMKKMRNEDRL